VNGRTWDRRRPLVPFPAWRSTKAEAAEALGVSVDFPDEHIAGELRMVSVVALYLQARKKVQSSTRLLTRDLLALA
jgi:hypothetical protein